MCSMNKAFSIPPKKLSVAYIDNRERGHVNDTANRRRIRQHLHRPCCAKQDRADGDAMTSHHLEQTVGNVGCIEIRHDQNIGFAGQRRLRIELAAYFL